MKTIQYSLCIIGLMVAASCEQDVIELQQPETEIDTSCEDADPGSADFTKFVAIGTSYTAGFQAGALFNAGQDNSLGQILATQFECVGGGAFNQPSIKTEHGYNIFISPNPVAGTVLGRFKLQGTPPQPAPVVSGMEAVPNPQVNPGFIYTGSAGAVASEDLNDFSVPAIQLGQALIYETGNWGVAGSDPRFSPFYARFASTPGGSSLVEDATASVANDGTFLLFWLGMDDALLHAAYGGDATRAPLTALDDFEDAYNFALANILLANPSVEAVVANYPDPFVMPHFTAVPWNAIPLDAGTATAVTTALANNYNAFLDGMVALQVITADEAALRKLTYSAGQNAILLNDETLTDLGPYMQGDYAGLQPYATARQTKSTDIIPLSTAAVLGQELGPMQVLGVTVPVEDQYVIIPSESAAIKTRLAEFNAHVKSVAESDTYTGRIAFADVNLAMKNLVTAQAGVSNGITYTPNINPPTGIYSEDGLHPNSRGYAFIANVFIDAINAKFGASVPKVNLSHYGATALPVNP